MAYRTIYQQVQNGDTFICIKGAHVDGHDFINEALKNGASKIIGEKECNIPNYKKVKNTKKYLTKVISKENRKLSKNFKIIGITGTKGKTTTSMICYQLLQKLGVKVAYIGTLGLYYENHFFELNNTTPDILVINEILNKLLQENITHIVMEVSSIALCEDRIQGLKFAIGAFTNFSQDHLDYHQTMDKYLLAKLKILKYIDGKLVVNKDDKSSTFFQKKKKDYLTVGKKGDLKICDYHLYQTSTLVNFDFEYNHYSVCIPFIGEHNIYNYLMALGIVLSLGYDILDIINYTNSLKPIKGRNELIISDKGYVVIDYAHSPKSVEATLDTFNQLKKGKIITIIGCGGNRDKLKRPIMGKVTTEKSDYVIFTSDNPRDEDPLTILKDITKDLTCKNYSVIENRETAIKKGIKMLKKNDYLLILGKGHENYQIKKTIKYHFDDKLIAEKYLK